MQRPPLSRIARASLLLLSALLLAAGLAHATPRANPAPATPTIRVARIPNVALTAPVWAGSAPGGGSTIYVAEQGGLIWGVSGSEQWRFLDVSNLIARGGEQGLLAMAFSRDYATSGRFWVYLIRPDGSGQVRQYVARAGRVVGGSGRIIINVPLAPPVATNHNGGQLWAGPRGLLYLSVGDGGGGGVEVGNSQRMNRLMGKLIRIAPKASGGYVVPRSNPFYARAGARREIYALGLRNPWRFSIDEPTGDIWIGDVGQGDREEIDRLRAGAPAGANFGWPRMEGNRTFSSSTSLAPRTSYVRPVLDYTHAGGACSITGGVVYRGSIASLRGWYVYADFCTDQLRLLHPATGRRANAAGVSGIVHVAQLADQSLVLVSSTEGALYRVLSS